MYTPPRHQPQPLSSPPSLLNGRHHQTQHRHQLSTPAKHSPSSSCGRSPLATHTPATADDGQTKAPFHQGPTSSSKPSSSSSPMATVSTPDTSLPSIGGVSSCSPPLRTGFKNISSSRTASHTLKAKSKGLPALELKFTLSSNQGSPKNTQALHRKLGLVDLRKSGSVSSSRSGGFFVNATPVPPPSAPATPATPISTTSALLPPNLTSASKKLKSKSQRLLRKFSAPVWKLKSAHRLFGNKEGHSPDRPPSDDDYSTAKDTHDLVSFYQSQSLSSHDLYSISRRADDSPVAEDYSRQRRSSNAHNTASPKGLPLPPVLSPVTHPNPSLHRSPSARSSLHNKRSSREIALGKNVSKEDLRCSYRSSRVPASSCSVEELASQKTLSSSVRAHRARVLSNDLSPSSSTGQMCLSNGADALALRRGNLPSHRQGKCDGLTSRQHKSSPNLVCQDGEGFDKSLPGPAAQDLLPSTSVTRDERSFADHPGKRSSVHRSLAPSSSLPPVFSSPGAFDSVLEESDLLNEASVVTAPSSQSNRTPPPLHRRHADNLALRRTLYSSATMQDAFPYDDVGTSTPNAIASPSRASSNLSPAHFSRRGSETTSWAEDGNEYSTESSTSSKLSRRRSKGVSSDTDDVRIEQKILAACARQEEYIQSFQQEYGKRGRHPVSAFGESQGGGSSGSHRISTIVSGPDEVLLAISLLEGRRNEAVSGSTVITGMSGSHPTLTSSPTVIGNPSQAVGRGKSPVGSGSSDIGHRLRRASQRGSTPPSQLTTIQDEYLPGCQADERIAPSRTKTKVTKKMAGRSCAVPRVEDLGGRVPDQQRLCLDVISKGDAMSKSGVKVGKQGV